MSQPLLYEQHKHKCPTTSHTTNIHKMLKTPKDKWVQKGHMLDPTHLKHLDVWHPKCLQHATPKNNEHNTHKPQSA